MNLNDLRSSFAKDENRAIGVSVGFDWHHFVQLPTQLGDLVKVNGYLGKDLLNRAKRWLLDELNVVLVHNNVYVWRANRDALFSEALDYNGVTKVSRWASRYEFPTLERHFIQKRFHVI